VDVTADVDFAMCRRAAERKGARVPALLSQGDFLMRMGVVQRVEQLLDSEETSDPAGRQPLFLPQVPGAARAHGAEVQSVVYCFTNTTTSPSF